MRLENKKGPKRPKKKKKLCFVSEKLIFFFFNFFLLTPQKKKKGGGGGGKGRGEQKEIVNCIIKNTTIDSYSFIVENNVFLLGYKS